MHRTITNL